jgi:acyl-CoA reductase-like NAD-dependent aldehyde dehydrogenase
MSVSNFEDPQELIDIANLPFPERAAALAKLADELEERLDSIEGEQAAEDEDERPARR